MSDGESSSVMREVEKLRECIGQIVDSPALEQFSSVWEEIGMEERHRTDRRTSILSHLQELLQDMVKEESELKEKLLKSVQACNEELDQLCQELSASEELHPDGMTLLEKERYLRTRVDTLAKEKHERMKRFKRLVEMECSMCASLGAELQLASKWQKQIVPSENELQLYRNRIEELEEAKNERQAEFFSIRQKIQHIWEEIETEPKGEFAQMVARGDITNFAFSLPNMDKLKAFHKEVEEKATELERTALELREVISSMWERLQVPQAERDAFNHRFAGFKPKIIKSLQAEVKRLKILKHQNMEKFVMATRKELEKVWDLCFFGPEQRSQSLPPITGKFTEDILCAHESELDRMRGFYKDNSDVFEQVENRELLWDSYIEFERSANNPNRYNNRGGQLWKDLKKRKQVMRELPKLEKELRAVLQQWEQDHGRSFVVRDEPYLDTMNGQWRDLKQQKEKEKELRHKNKEEITMMEMVYGSKPASPMKRHATVTTPSSAPSCKVPKVGPSPLVHTTATTYSTRRKMALRNSSKTPSRRRCLPRKVLGERNSQATSSVESSLISNINTSLASTGSYTDFQHGLHQGFDCKKTARSSTFSRNPNVDSSESII